MFERIYQQHWINLPKETRQHLVKVFSLGATGITEVRDNTVVSDGFTNTDLERITLSKMAEYVGSSLESMETFARLWEITLSKVNQELYPPIMLPEEKVVYIPGTQPRTQPETDPSLLIELPTPYCNQCTSKGGRHKNTCPLYR